MSMLLSLLLVVVYQYTETGVWMGYFTAQQIQWRHSFQWPEFPLDTWDHLRLLWLDGFAWICTLLALFVLLRELPDRLRVQVRVPSTTAEDPAFRFLLVYLACCGLYTLFFHPRDALGGTSLMSLNRYTLGTPFFVTGIHFARRYLSDFPGLIRYLGITLLLTLPLLGAGTRQHPDEWSDLEITLYFSAIALWLPAMLLKPDRRITRLAGIPLILAGAWMQCWLLARYLSGWWIG